jgi:peptidoglycan/xylan/chitin deacetylase (PgdA/CDA1 family)
MTPPSETRERGWSDAPWRTRLLRRLRLHPALLAPLAARSSRWAELAEDLGYWRARRAEVAPERWRRDTSSYVVLVYHRFAGELKPGQERIDVAPGRFRAHLRLLRALGFKPLAPDQLLAFHRGELNELPRRRFVVTVDDAMADAVEPLRRAASLSPQLFVPTAELGGGAHWIDGEPVAGWEEIRELAAAGVAIGSHTRHHRRLSRLGAAEREVELAGSLAELREQVPAAIAAIAYPNGDHDEAVCAATAAAGYEIAFTTEKGRNDAATDPYRLRRISVHGTDGPLAVLWKVLSGEALPGWWPHLRR